MKGEERVCHVTEADRLGAAKAVRPFGWRSPRQCVRTYPRSVFMRGRRMLWAPAPCCRRDKLCRGCLPLTRGAGFCPCARRFCAAEPTG